MLSRSRPTQAAAVPRPPSSRSTLTLYGRGWQHYGPDHHPGQTPVVGQRLTTYGELLGRRDGAPLGEFHAAHMGTGSPFLSGPYAVGSLEFHTFTLPDGAIMGMGVTTGDPAVFAIVGGTGRYEGASGSYVARQRPVDQGGDGSAHFVFTFVTPAARAAV
jgi:hypothetical protein